VSVVSFLDFLLLSSGSILFLVPLFRFWRDGRRVIEGAVSLLRGHFLTLDASGCVRSLPFAVMNVSPLFETWSYTSILDAAIHGQLSPELSQKSKEQTSFSTFPRGHSRCFAVCLCVDYTELWLMALGWVLVFL
jgi:hypothetical protein